MVVANQARSMIRKPHNQLINRNFCSYTIIDSLPLCASEKYHTAKMMATVCAALAFFAFPLAAIAAAIPE